MITRITKENRAKYVRLFAKATEALKASDSKNYPEEFFITSLEEYFKNIEELFNLDPKYVRLPLDEETFDIDLNTRQITVPASFKKSGLGVQGDDLAETVYFRTDRFFDMTDLNETFIVIQWEAPNGKKMASPAYFQEIDSETNKLIFGWAVTKSMTTTPGALKFSVAFIDGEVVNAEGDELDIQGLEYRLGTLTSSININSGLNIASNGKILFEDRLVALKNRIQNSTDFGDIIDGVAGLADILEYFGYAWDEPHTFDNIFTDLMDDPTKDGVEQGLPLLAVSPEAGLISYEFYKEGREEPLLQGPAAIRYIPVTYPEPEDKEAIYFIKEGQDNFRYFDEGIDSWMIPVDDEGNEVINPLLHERIAFLPIEGPGKYYAKITNREDNLNASVLDTRDNKNGGLVNIPGPTAIKSIIVSTKEENKDIFTDEEPVELKCTVVFDIEGTEKVYDNLEYQWCKRIIAEDETISYEEVINAKNENHITQNVGDYALKIKNHWNKAETDWFISDNFIEVYYAAIKVKPEDITFKPEINRGQMLDGTTVIDLADVNDKLVVTFPTITQTHSKQYVRWLIYDVVNKKWDYIKTNDENGKEIFVEGNEYVATKEGDYKAEIYNEITAKNIAKTMTDEELVEGDSWVNKIIRVVDIVTVEE